MAYVKNLSELLLEGLLEERLDSLLAVYTTSKTGLRQELLTHALLGHLGDALHEGEELGGSGVEVVRERGRVMVMVIMMAVVLEIARVPTVDGVAVDLDAGELVTDAGINLTPAEVVDVVLAEFLDAVVLEHADIVLGTVGALSNCGETRRMITEDSLHVRVLTDGPGGLPGHVVALPVVLSTVLGQLTGMNVVQMDVITHLVALLLVTVPVGPRARFLTLGKMEFSVVLHVVMMELFDNVLGAHNGEVVAVCTTIFLAEIKNDLFDE